MGQLEGCDGEGCHLVKKKQTRGDYYLELSHFSGVLWFHFPFSINACFPCDVGHFCD